MSVFRQTANIPASSNDNIGNYISGATAGQLVLAGDAVAPDGNVYFDGYSSAITITTDGNIAADFTIIGTYRGQVITEIITKDIITDTVSSNYLFDSITSISLSDTVTFAFTIGSNYNVAVHLEYSSLVVNNIRDMSRPLVIPNYKFGVSICSVTTSDTTWNATNLLVYGITDIATDSLKVLKLSPSTKPTNYINIMPAPSGDNYTAAQLSNGMIIDLAYPFVEIIVFVAQGVNNTAMTIEITQS